MSSEYEHLKTAEERDRDELVRRAKQLDDEGWTQRDIAEELGISAATVNRFLKEE